MFYHWMFLQFLLSPAPCGRKVGWYGCVTGSWKDHIPSGFEKKQKQTAFKKYNSVSCISLNICLSLSFPFLQWNDLFLLFLCFSGLAVVLWSAQLSQMNSCWHSLELRIVSASWWAAVSCTNAVVCQVWPDAMLFFPFDWSLDSDCGLCWTLPIRPWYVCLHLWACEITS